jgi:hypothetical protein
MQIKASVMVCWALGISVAWGQAAPQAPAPAAGQAPSTSAPAPTQPQPTASPVPRPPVPEAEKPYPYVRKISAGATLSVLGLKMVKGGTSNVVTTTPSVDALYSSSDKSQRIGYGLTAQVSLSSKFALNGSFLLRKIGYIMDADILKGTTTITQAQFHEDTRARIHEIPIVVRYYTIDRHRPGPRFFLELGGALRNVKSIRTSISDTDNDGVTTCCRTTAAVPAHRTVRGLVGGMGVQFIDPVGVRLVPEVRYTRWMADTFNNFSSRTQRHQVEAMVSLTF